MFAISLAMQINKEIQLGIILNPVTNEIYFATKNKGAFLNGERIFVSSRDEIKESLFVATFSSETTKKISVHTIYWKKGTGKRQLPVNKKNRKFVWQNWDLQNRCTTTK